VGSFPVSIESGNETFVFENDFLVDAVHHKLIRSFSSSSIVTIPWNIKTLGVACFSKCESLSSISFESNSRLIRIESDAFSFSSLRSIVIPRSVQCIKGSAFIGLTQTSILVQPGNETFTIEGAFLVDILHHRLIRCFSNSSNVIIPWTISILGAACFSKSESLSAVSFEFKSQLTRIESDAFSYSSLRSIVIPCNVEFLCSLCFWKSQALSSISFESPSRLKCIESQAFSSSLLRSIVIPHNVRFIDSSAFVDVVWSSLSMADGGSCPEFGLAASEGIGVSN
jgi:hypothetical protein